MKKGNIIGFYSPEDDYGYLSNWYPSTFRYGRYTYSSAEQFMMAQKAFLFRDYDAAYIITGTDDPQKIKKAGKQVENYDEELWNKLRQPIMRRGLRAKFQQNPDLLTQLLDTGSAILAEASPRDKIWGIGLAGDKEEVQNPKQWCGQNLLGKTLMEVRSDLRKWIAVAGGDISYQDAVNIPANEIWSMLLQEVLWLPEFRESIDIYNEVVKFRVPGRNYLYEEYNGTLAELEESMRCNMGGGLPATWFWEMKQEIYDLVRFGG